MTKRLVATLELVVEVKVEERDGYYAATTMPFALTTYGNTEDEAEKRARQAVLLLLGKHNKSPDEMSAYLSRLRVKHVLLKRTEAKESEPPRVTRECKQELRMEVPAGV